MMIFDPFTTADDHNFGAELIKRWKGFLADK